THAGADLLDGHDNRATSLSGVCDHRFLLQCECLLIVRRDSGVETHLYHADRPAQKPSPLVPSKPLMFQGAFVACYPAQKLYFLSSPTTVNLPILAAATPASRALPRPHSTAL